MKDMKHHLEEVCCAKDTLMGWVTSEIGKGKECFDLEAVGETVDIIKDLAEAEEKCVKACYYKQLMEKDEFDFADLAEEMSERYGYSSQGSRGARSGAYHGGNSHAARSARAHAEARNMNGRFSSMGYQPNARMMWEEDRDWDGSQYQPYKHPMEEYRETKRHYHESHREEDRKMMETHEQKAMEDAFTTMKELIGDASPASKQKLEAGLQNLMVELKKV